MNLRRSLLGVAALVMVLLGIGSGLRWFSPGGGPPPGIQGAAYAEPRPIPDFQLQDQDGEALSKSSLSGRWTLLYFGYTYCPDVCPTTLQTLGSLQRQLDERGIGDDVEVLFVSVDPARDTPERLAQYAPFFGPRVRGATGDDQSLSKLSEALGVVYARAGSGDDTDYLVDHNSAVLLVDPQTRLYAVMTAPHTVDQLINDFLALREHYG